MQGLIRQGDILLTPFKGRISDYRSDYTRFRVKRDKDEGVIIAEGEATGHHHRIRTKGVVLYRDRSNAFLKVPKGGAELTHEEHETLFIPAGLYRVENQREYAPQAAPVRVYD